MSVTSFVLLALVIVAAVAQLPQPALIKVEATSDIGILLDEFPAEAFPRVVAWGIARPDSFWVEAVRKQLSLALYRLLYRQLWYGGGSGKGALPIPVDDLNITFTTAPAQRNMNGRDVVMRTWTMSGFIVTDVDSAAASDPFLGTIGGTTMENFVLPLDPYLVFQRSGYACIDEAQFPLDSMDSEGPLYFFDDTCGPEAPYNFDGGCNQCHCTVTVSESCRSNLGKTMGKTSVAFVYTRLPLDMNTVLQVEARNRFNYTSTLGADMLGSIDGMNHNYIVYKYLPENSCTMKECNGGGFGWRRLMYFDATHVNVGTKPLEIGKLAYLQAEASSFDPLIYHNLYYWDTCHQHPHFSGYATYDYGGTLGHKQGFCVMSTGREVNARWSPITNPNADCMNQGIQQGWSDAYNAGIPCQWVDVTPLDTSKKPVSQTLTMVSNFKNWLCEGTVNRDANGDPIWVPTGEYTATGQSIDKYSCNDTPGALQNNVDSVTATVPLSGNSIITAPCFDGPHAIGPKRDCAFTLRTQTSPCSAGGNVTLSCTIAANAPSQVLRICEASVKLQSGLACRFNDDGILANVLVTPGSTTIFTFKCPAARDINEPGGLYSSYSAPVFNPDALSAISCSVV